MRPLVLLLATPVLFVAGCTAPSHSTATPTTAAPTSASAGPVGTGTPSGPAKTGSPTSTTGGGSATGTATPRCHTGDLKLTLGKRGGATATKFQPLYFTNVADQPCTLHGYPHANAEFAAYRDV